MVYTLQKFKKLIELLEIINTDNSVDSIRDIVLDYITSSNIKNKIINNELIRIDEIKEDIISNIKIDYNDYSIDDFIMFVKLIGIKQDGRCFRLSIHKFGLVSRIKNMPFLEQEKYVSELVNVLKSQLPINIIDLWSAFCESAQRKSINELINQDISPVLFNSLWYYTKDSVKEDFPLDDLLNVIEQLLFKCKNEDDRETICRTLMSISSSIFNDNYEKIIKFVRNNNIDLYNIVPTGYSKHDRDLIELFKNNVEIVVDNYIDDMNSINDIIYIFGTTLTLNEFINDSCNSKYINIGEKVFNKIKNTDNMINYLVENDYNNIIVLLWKYNQEFRDLLNDDDIFSLIKNNVISLKDIYDKNDTFIEENINTICSYYLSLQENVKLLELLICLPKNVLDKIEFEYFYKLLDKKILSYSDLLLNYYKVVPDELKKALSSKVLIKFLTEKVNYFYHYSNSSDPGRVIDDFFRSSPSLVLTGIDESIWDKIFELNSYSLTQESKFRYAPDNICNKYFSSYVDDLSSRNNDLKDLNHLTYILSDLPRELLIKNSDLLIDNNNTLMKNALLQCLEHDELSDDLLNRIINDPIKLKNYMELLKINENLNKTIIIDMLDDKFVDLFGKSVLTRVTAYPNIQINILKFKNDKFILNTIKRICEKYDNWVELLDYGLNTTRSNYSYDYDVENPAILLLKKVTDGDFSKVNDEIIKNCYRIACDKENYFDINNYEDIVNYNYIVFNKCLEVLNGNVSNIYTFNDGELKNKDRIDQLKFAIAEIEFGMDYDSILNLTKKYGVFLNSIDNTKLNSQEVKIISLLNNMKRICNSNNLDNEVDKIINNKEYYLNRLNNCLSSLEIEKICLNMYEKLYQETLFIPKKGINEILPNEYGEYKFNMIVRCEGAYNPNWVEPDNFKEAINMPRIDYRGNCKSYIGNNLLGFPRNRGPIYGYSSVNIDFQAPWDINSDAINQQFSLRNVKWNYGVGIEFLPPSTMINRTRHAHNEFVSDRLVYNIENNCYEKDSPDYVIWIKTNTNETDEDRSNNDLWRMTLKAAKDLDIPIVIIDKEKVLESENRKIYNNIEKLKKIDANTDIRLILENIVLQFHNNMISVKYDDLLREKYFNVEERENIFNIIDNIIDQYKDNNPKIYRECINVMYQLITDELSKMKSNNGIKIIESDNFLKKRADFYKDKLFSFNRENRIDSLIVPEERNEEIVISKVI